MTSPDAPEKAPDEGAGADPAPALSAQGQAAISRWDNEGGAIGGHPPPGVPAQMPDLTNAELVQLRVRVIALENLMIAILSQATPRQIILAGAMAAHIAPRADATAHPLTVQAAHRMDDLVRRAGAFRDPAMP